MKISSRQEALARKLDVPEICPPQASLLTLLPSLRSNGRLAMKTNQETAWKEHHFFCRTPCWGAL